MWSIVRGVLQAFGNKPTSIHSAARSGDLETIRTLARQLPNIDAEENAEGSQNWSALQFAAWYGHSEAIKELMKFGASPARQDKNGCTALHLAVMMGRKDAAECLLRGGAEVDAEDKKGMTPLHRCAIEGDESVVALLLKYQANMEAIDKNGGTALHLACWKGHKSVVCKLLDWGAFTTAMDNEGNTPLHEAAIAGHGDIMEKLIQIGAPTHIRNKDGMTAQDLLVRFGREAMEAISLNGIADNRPEGDKDMVGRERSDGWGESSSESDWEAIDGGRCRHPEGENRRAMDRDDGWGESESIEDWDLTPATGRHEGARPPDQPSEASDVEVRTWHGVIVVNAEELLRSCMEGYATSTMFGKLVRCFFQGKRVIVRQFRNDAFSDLLLAVQLQHPHLATVLGVCLNPPQLLLDAADGTLSDYLFHANRTMLSWGDRLRIMMEVTAALAYLESVPWKNLAHGPLSCDSVYLAEDLHVKLFDFGIPWNNETQSKDALIGSLGLLFLRLLTGNDCERLSFEVKLALQSNSFYSMLDHRAGGWPITESVLVARLALKCIEGAGSAGRPDLRLCILETLKMVHGNLGFQLPREVPPPQVTDGDLEVAEAQTPGTSQQEPPSLFVCPITHELMRDPVVAADGYTYERAEIEDWISRGHPTSPMTNAPLLNLHLTSNHALKSAISEWGSGNAQF
ncbi:hypothetical protein BSKO_07095 [Bryopsis sp. KO-2023]|nr:hypothetical protein BSKO_07095 [Bryopsis sp. KO-2023]